MVAAADALQGGGDALTPQVALDPDGDGAVVWARYDGRTSWSRARLRRAGPGLDKLFGARDGRRRKAG